jgi:tripartite-type tricarboxylate transporter receptor subunit TctC
MAQDYPSQIVKFIVPFGPGGPANVAAGPIGKDLQESLKLSFIVENRTAPAPRSCKSALDYCK